MAKQNAAGNSAATMDPAGHSKVIVKKQARANPGPSQILIREQVRHQREYMDEYKWEHNIGGKLARSMFLKADGDWVPSNV